MEISKNVVFVCLVITCTFFQATDASATFCFQHKCRECNQNEDKARGTENKCELRSLVSLTWLDGDDKPSIGNDNQNIDYSCIKMVASNPNVVGDSTDVIKGCALKDSAQRLCDALVGEELARGKKDARCLVCTGELCNGSSGLQISLGLLAITTLIAKFLNH